MRAASWNLNSIRSRTPLLHDFLRTESPDVVALQETRCTDATFPWSLFTDHGYEVAHLGTGGHGGVALASRIGLERVQYGFGGEHGPPFDQPRLLGADCGGLRFVSLYAPNGQKIRTAAWQIKLAWFELLRIELELELQTGSPLVVLGDFNVCPTPADVYDPVKKRNRNLVSKEERSAVQRLVDLGLHDVARTLHPDDPGFTWFSFTPGQFESNRGYRLDLALSTPGVLKTATACVPLLDWRLPDRRPSDHAPLMLTLDDTPPAL